MKSSERDEAGEDGGLTLGIIKPLKIKGPDSSIVEPKSGPHNSTFSLQERFEQLPPK